MAQTLVALLDELVRSSSHSGSKDDKGGRASSVPTLRSVILPLPSLDANSFRVFRVSSESAIKSFASLTGSAADRSLKNTEIALAPHSLAVSALSTVSNIGPLSFLRLDFPLSFLLYKQRTQSLA